jgi:reactive intermediate/imine deaminase
MTPRAIVPDGVAPPGGSYSHAMAATGEVVMVAGQVGVDADGTLAGPDAEAQARQAYRNLVAVLEAAGAGPGDVIKLTTFLTDAADAAAVGRARGEFFEAPYPASSVVVVAGLLQPDWVVEIEAVAVVAR